MLARLEHKVVRLCRVAIGPLFLGELPLGAHRRLTAEELESLRKAAAGTTRRRKPVGKKKVAKRVTQSGKGGKGAKRTQSGSRDPGRKKSGKKSAAKVGTKPSARRGVKKKSTKTSVKKKAAGRAASRGTQAPRKRRKLKTRSKRR